MQDPAEAAFLASKGIAITDAAPVVGVAPVPVKGKRNTGHPNKNAKIKKTVQETRKSKRKSIKSISYEELSSDDNACGCLEKKGLGPIISTDTDTENTEQLEKDIFYQSGPTLIVCPSSAMLQWKDEIAKFTAPGTLNVLVYYNNRDRVSI